MFNLKQDNCVLISRVRAQIKLLELHLRFSIYFDPNLCLCSYFPILAIYYHFCPSLKINWSFLWFNFPSIWRGHCHVDKSASLIIRSSDWICFWFDKFNQSTNSETAMLSILMELKVQKFTNILISDLVFWHKYFGLSFLHKYFWLRCQGAARVLSY